MQPANPEFKSVIEGIITKNHFAYHLGVEIVHIGEGEVEARLEVTDKHLQQNGFAHGGVLSSLCDIVAGLAAFTLVPDDKHVVTAEIKVNYLRPAIGEVLIAKGNVVKAGNTIHYCEASVWMDRVEDAQLAVRATTSMAVIPAR